MQTSCKPHECPQAPQLSLSLCTVAQYGAPPSGAHATWPPGQVETHLPVEQRSPGLHTSLHEPQLPLSLCRLAQ